MYAFLKSYSHYRPADPWLFSSFSRLSRASETQMKLLYFCVNHNSQFIIICMKQKSSPSSAKESKLVFSFQKVAEYTQKDCKIITAKHFNFALIAI